MGHLAALCFVCVVALTATSVAAQTASVATTYERDVEAFRNAYEKELLADEGYLTLCGLFFLNDGENSLGSAPDSIVRLGADVAPARAGTVFVENGTYRFALRDGLTARLDGTALSESRMRISIPEIDQRADRFGLGRVTFWIHMSGTRPAIRVRDPQCHVRQSFSGLKWFGIDPRWASPATLSKYEVARQLDIINILGDQARVPSPGLVRVVVDGRPFEMVPVVDGKDLMLYFTDATAGIETYKAVRFVKAEARDDGTYVVDFNKAYNPPCAYSEYTTCPMPPRENRLPLAIPAGERAYHQ